MATIYSMFISTVLRIWWNYFVFQLFLFSVPLCHSGPDSLGKHQWPVGGPFLVSLALQLHKEAYNGSATRLLHPLMLCAPVKVRMDAPSWKQLMLLLVVRALENHKSTQDSTRKNAKSLLNGTSLDNWLFCPAHHNPKNVTDLGIQCGDYGSEHQRLISFDIINN